MKVEVIAIALCVILSVSFMAYGWSDNGCAILKYRPKCRTTTSTTTTITTTISGALSVAQVYSYGLVFPCSDNSNGRITGCALIGWCVPDSSHWYNVTTWDFCIQYGSFPQPPANMSLFS